MEKIPYKFREMQPGELLSGYSYLVRYYDFVIGKHQIAAAIWKKPEHLREGYFEYCMKSRFVSKKSPQFNKDTDKYRIDSCASVIQDWEEA